MGEGIGNLSLLTFLRLNLGINEIVDVTEVGEGIENLTLLDHLMLDLGGN